MNADFNRDRLLKRVGAWTDEYLTQQYALGPGAFMTEAWEIIKAEVMKRELPSVSTSPDESSVQEAVLEGHEPEESPMELVVVAQFRHRHEADMALGYLNEAGIDAVRLVDDAGYGFSFSPPRIMVSAAQADEARDILESVGIDVIRG